MTHSLNQEEEGSSGGSFILEYPGLVVLSRGRNSVLIVTRLIDETSDQTQSVGDSVVRCIVICSGVSIGWSLSHFQDTSTSDTSTSDLM